MGGPCLHKRISYRLKETHCNTSVDFTDRMKIVDCNA